jgi:GNAT superfamily N-acetyltransferase
MFTSHVIPFNYSYKIKAVSPFSSALTIRPAQTDDVSLMVEMHQALSVDILNQRYQGAQIPSLQSFRQPCTLDGPYGRTFLALFPGKNIRLAGMATYLINQDIPIIAEVILLVADEDQGQGIGRKLMNHLIEDAQKQNIRFFEGYMKSSNIAMIHLFNSSGKLVEGHIENGRVEMRIELPGKQPKPV